MPRSRVLFLAVLALVLGWATPQPLLAQRRSRARTTYSSGEHHHRSSYGYHAPRSHRRRASPRYTAPGETRDSHGRIRRSRAAKDAFERETGHPHGWPGHVVDHIVPLACGGADDPSNMQWQTTADGKAKDKVERTGCSR